MTREEALRNIDRLMREAELLADMDEDGVLHYVQFCGSRHIYIKDDLDYLEVRRAFRKFFKKNERLSRYYMNADDNIALVYSYGEWSLILFFSNVQEMLELVSRGTCRVDKREVTKAEHYIACDI